MLNKFINFVGSALDDLGQFEEAIKNYDQAIKLNPNKDNYYYNKGIENKN